MKTTKVKKVKVSEKIYKISLSLGDRTIKAKGATAFEALKNLDKPLKIITKGVVTMTEGKRKMIQLFQPSRCKRMFYPLAQVIFAKQFEYLLK